MSARFALSTALAVCVSAAPVLGQTRSADADKATKAPAKSWTRPWTFAMDLTRKDESQQPFEYACHEGNYGLSNILSAARAAEEEQKSER